MAKKLDTTPDGIVCAVCGEDKPAYHYFKHSGKYTQDFFTTEAGYTNGVCFDCAGPYKCISCGQIKPASEYRLQGRVCSECKNAPKMAQGTALPALNSDFDANKVSVVEDGIESLESDVWGDG